MKIGLGNGISQFRASGGGAPPAVVPFQSVNADGFSVTYDSPVVASPEAFNVMRQGYVGTTPTAIPEVFYCTKRMRLVYPNQATISADRVSLSRYLLSSDLVSGATNNSPLTAPEAVANWGTRDRTLIGDTLTAEIVAGSIFAKDREQVAAVEFYATDGTTTVSQVVTESVISGRAGDQLPVIVYPCNLDISTLANPATITLNAKVYSHIGDAANILDSAAQSLAREFSPRTYRRDTAMLAAPRVAYVRTAANGGNDGTGVASTVPATASANPFLTILGAVNAHHTAGGLDCAIIYIGDDQGAPFVLGTTAVTRTQSHTVLTITREQGVARANARVSFGTTAFSMRFGAAGGWCAFVDVGIVRTGTQGLAGTATSNLNLYFDGVTFENNGHNAGFYNNSDGAFYDTVFSDIASSPLNISTRDHRVFRGCVIPSAGNSIESYLLIGCKITAPANALSTGTKTASGSMIVFNDITLSAATPSGVSAASAADVNGMVVSQNVIAFTSATANPIMRMCADAAAGNLTNAVIHHNTFAGFFAHGRSNICYDEGPTPRTCLFVSIKNNIMVQFNIKGDVFRGANEAGPDASTRVGNWATLYGVECEGNFTIYQDASNGTWSQEYAGANSSIGTSATVANDPLFVDNRATTIGPVAGSAGGNYALQAGSPAKGIAQAVLRFDAAGATRTAITSAGAYQ